MKTKISIFAVLFVSLAFLAQAAAIYPVPQGFFSRMLSAIRRCTWHLSCYRTPFGADITTILGTDTLKDSRTTINTNFTSLNNYKIENSSTSIAAITTLSNLASVGTLTTGTWNATAIGVAKGGTGTTSPTLNYVLLGDGSSGLKVVNSLGTSGEFLQSQGAGSPPKWVVSAVDQAAAYNWTNNHTWTASSTFRGGPLNVSGTTTTGMLVVQQPYGQFNGVNYRFPSSQGTSSSGLVNDGNGGLTWTGGAMGRIYAFRHDYASTTGCGAQTLRSFTLTGNDLGPNGTLIIRATFRVEMDGAADQSRIQLNVGGTNYASLYNQSYTRAEVEFTVRNFNATNAQTISGGIMSNSTSTSALDIKADYVPAQIDTTSNQTVGINVTCDPGQAMVMQGMEAIIYP